MYRYISVLWVNPIFSPDRQDHPPSRCFFSGCTSQKSEAKEDPVCLTVRGPTEYLTYHYSLNNLRARGRLLSVPLRQDDRDHPLVSLPLSPFPALGK